MLADLDRDARGDAERELEHFGLLIGESAPMRAVYEQIEKVARTDSPVLDRSARRAPARSSWREAIHRASGRTGRFVAVNCGSLSRELAGSELFGHEKGSFTGAVRRHLGFFKRADSGTLFLDELAEMPLELQPHFLRVLENGVVLPVGSEQEERVDARVIAATNRDPKQGDRRQSAARGPLLQAQRLSDRVAAAARARRRRTAARRAFLAHSRAAGSRRARFRTRA